MHLDRTLTVTLYDKHRVRQGWIGNYVSASVTERWLGQSTGTITVNATDPNLPKMLTKGARVSVDFGDTENVFLPNSGYRMISGPLRRPRGSFLADGTVTFDIEGDWRLLRNTRAEVVPGSPLQVAALTEAGQSYDVGAPPPAGEDSGRTGYYQWPAGALSSQSAAAALMNDQINALWQRLLGEDAIFGLSSAGGAGGLGIDVSGILPQVRFGTVEEYIVPLLEVGNVGLRILQAGGEGVLIAGFWTPKTWETAFTPESGVVRDGDWSIADSEATIAAVGGPGELSARAFYEVADSTGIMADHHDIIQVFREATGAPVQWPTTLDEKYRIAKYYLLRPEITADQKVAFQTFLQTAGEGALADGAGTAGVSLQLAESEGFRFTGDDAPVRGFAVGDIITVKPSASTQLTGLEFTDRIRETTVTVNSKGLTVTPQLGQRKDDPDEQFALAVRALAMANSRRNTNQ